MSVFPNIQFAEEPREKHYVFAHVALRQVCEQDPHYFFAIMASPEQTAFLQHIVQQVNDNHTDENSPDHSEILDVNRIQVVISHVKQHPVLLIKMPAPTAYLECAYVGLVALVDMYQPQQTPEPQIRYFTLEVSEGASEEAVLQNDLQNDLHNELHNHFAFCEWQQDKHLNLAEVSINCTLEEFGMLISHQFEQSSEN